MAENNLRDHIQVGATVASVQILDECENLLCNQKATAVVIRIPHTKDTQIAELVRASFNACEDHEFEISELFRRGASFA